MTRKGALLGPLILLGAGLVMGTIEATFGLPWVGLVLAGSMTVIAVLAYWVARML